VKVAVISQGSPDYLIDIVTDGLIRLLGRDRVHLRYNQTSTADPNRTQLLNGFGGQNKIDFLEANLLVASVRSNPADIAAWVKETHGGRVAIADGEDDSVLRAGHYAIAAIYYKREFLPKAGYPARVRPLPFAAIPEERPEAAARGIPVSFSVGITSPIRAEIQGVLKAMGVKADMVMRTKKEYNSILSRSLIGVSARGAGWDTYRYWETAYFGCALLSQRLAITIPGNFIDGKEAIFFDGIGDFQKKLDGLLADPARAASIGNASRAACMDRHLSIHRAKTVLEGVL
jgi:hypothetical protein